MKLERTVLPPDFTGGAALTTTFISVADAAKQVFGDATYDSVKLTRDISAVYYAAERYCERAFFTQTWKLALDDFPNETMINRDAAIYLPLGKVQAIGSLAYRDSDGASQTLVENTDFYLENIGDSARLTPTEALGNWPSVSDYYRGSVVITFDVGYGVTLPDDKQDVKIACMLALGDLYENRQSKTPINLFESGLYDMYLKQYKIYYDYELHNNTRGLYSDYVW